MMFDKSKLLIGCLGFAVLGLVLLLVRENEGRVSAETKLGDLQYKLESASNESDNLILELRGTLHDQEVKIADMVETHRAEILAKSGEIEEYQKQLQDSTAHYEQVVSEKDSDIAEGKKRTQEESERFNLALGQKSDRIKDLGAQLEEASKRYTSLLKEKELLEAENFSIQQDLSAAQNELKKLQREYDRVSSALKAMLDPKPDSSTHD